MNVYHIAYVPGVKTVHLHFWGCNLSCRACFQVGDNPWRPPIFEEMDAAVRIAKKHLVNISCLRGDAKPTFEAVRIF